MAKKNPFLGGWKDKTKASLKKFYKVSPVKGYFKKKKAIKF